jgi:hypothetical protein
MKMIIYERTRISKIKPEWNMFYWVISVYDKKMVYSKYHNKMFEPLEVLIENLKTRFPITEISMKDNKYKSL